MYKLIKLLEQDSEYTVDEMNFASSIAELPEIGKVAIVHSDADKIIPFKDAEKAHGILPGFELIKLKNQGHYRIPLVRRSVSLRLIKQAVSAVILFSI
jgi:hypothetical protein